MSYYYRRRLRRVTAAPCLLAYAYVAELWAQSLVKLSDDVFHEPVREPFGEHVGEEEENEENEENEEEAILEASWVHLGPSWALLGPYWLSPGTSWGPLGPVLGASRAALVVSWAFLGAAGYYAGGGRLLCRHLGLS